MIADQTSTAIDREIDSRLWRFCILLLPSG